MVPSMETVIREYGYEYEYVFLLEYLLVYRKLMKYSDTYKMQIRIIRRSSLAVFIQTSSYQSYKVF